MRRTTQALTGEVVFVGPPTKTAGALKLYTKAKAGIVEVCVGDGVVLKGRSVEEEDKQGPLLGLVQALWEDSKGACGVDVVWMWCGCDACIVCGSWVYARYLHNMYTLYITQHIHTYTQANPLCSCVCWCVVSKQCWVMLLGSPSCF